MSCACSPIAPLLSPSSLIASPVERVFDTMPSRQPCRVLTGTWGQLVRRDPIAPGSGAQERPGPARGRRPAKQARALAQLAEEACAPAWTGACADLTASPRDDRRLRSGDRLQRLGLGLRELDRAGAGEGLRPAARGRARPAAAPAVDAQSGRRRPARPWRRCGRRAARSRRRRRTSRCRAGSRPSPGRDGWCGPTRPRRPVHRRRTSSCNQARPGRWPSRSARGPAASWLSPAVGRCVARTVRQQPRSLALGARRWRRPRPGRRAGRSGSRRGRRRRAGRGGRSPVGADRWLGKDARMLPGSGKDVRITPLRVSVRSLYGLTMTTTPRSAPTLAPAFGLDRFLQLPRVSGLALAPDGRRLVAAVATAAPDGKRFVTALWELDPDGERPPRRLTRSAPGESGAAFLPDGSVLFTSTGPDPDADHHDDDDDEVASLWLLPAGGGEARIVAAAPGGIATVRTARRTGTVAFLANLFPGVESLEEDREHGKARENAGVGPLLFESYPVRYWDHSLGPRQPRL